MAETIGGIRVTVGADYSDLQTDLQAAEDQAQQSASAIAEAMNSAATGSDALNESMGAAADTTGNAAEQLSLFAADADAIPFADASGQLNLFTDDLETFAGSTNNAAESVAALSDEADSAIPPLEGLTDETKDATEAAEGSGDAFKDMASHISELAGQIGVGIGIGELAHEFWDAFTEIDDASRVLTHIEGNAAEAKRQIEELENIAKADALSMPQLLVANQRMEATGHFLQGDIIPALMAAANASANMHSELESVAQRMMMVADTGVAMNRALMSLNINSADLGKALGVTAAEAAKAFKDLDDPAKRLEILTAAMQKNAGAAAALAQGWSAGFVRAGNEIKETFSDVGKMLTEGLNRSAVTSLSDGIEKAGDIGYKSGVQIHILGMETVAAADATVKHATAIEQWTPPAEKASVAAKELRQQMEALNATVKEAPKAGMDVDNARQLAAVYKEAADSLNQIIPPLEKLPVLTHNWITATESLGQSMDTALNKDANQGIKTIGASLSQSITQVHSWADEWQRAGQRIADSLISTVVDQGLMAVFRALGGMTGLLASLGLGGGGGGGFYNPLEDFTGLTIGSFAGGGDTGAGGLAMLHANEMVLPEHEANVIRGLSDSNVSSTQNTNFAGMFAGAHFYGTLPDSMVADLGNKIVRSVRQAGGTW